MYNWEAGSLVITVPNKVGGENSASQQENILTAACQYVLLKQALQASYSKKNSNTA